MKKNIHKFSIILVSVFLCFLSFNISDAGTGVYTYKDKTSGIKSGSFATKELCEKERAVKFLTATTTDCEETIAMGEPEVTKVDPQNTGPSASDDYDLLAPIGDYDKAPKNIGDYFNTILEIAIGLCAVLAVVMIVIGGVQYMGNESIFGKTEAKSQITKSILGLFIAIGAFALLNTIDPNLLGKQGLTVKQVSAEIVDLPDAGDGTVDPDFKKKDGSYSTDASISTGVTSAISKLKQGWTINQFRVYTNNRMVISLKKENAIDNTNIIDIKPGINGYIDGAQAKVGDRKTPKGTWKILSLRTSSTGKPVYNKTGSNMGASFWLLSPMTNGERGIGMHGNKNGTLSETYGCIRLKNADILALLPYVKSGITVVIGD